MAVASGIRNGIDLTVNASFPRSGNHLLLELLERVYPEGTVRACDTHEEPWRRIGVCAETNLQKTHDLKLDEPVLADHVHLVQVRYPVESIVSWYRMATASGLTDTPENWQLYAMRVASFWLRFYRKWVLDPVPNRVLVDYASLVDDTAGTLRRVCDALGGPAVSSTAIGLACESVDTTRRNDVRSFKYHGKQFFGALNGYFCTTPGVDVEGERLRLDQLSR